MRLILAALFVGLLAHVAFAQQPAPQPPEQQALANRLMQEISASLQCQTTLITTQKELEELKKKHEPAPPPEMR